MEKNKLIVLLFASLFLITLVSAVPTLVTPATSAQVTGTTVSWNATNSSGLIGMTTCNIWIKSVSLTANTTYVNVSTASNTTADQTNITGTFNSVLFEDGNDYSIFAECGNATGGSLGNSTAKTGIIIDNGVPTTPSSLSPATNTGITSATTQTFSATVGDASTTSCTYTINRFLSSQDTLSASGSGTYATNSCSFDKTFSTSADNGVYTYTITASDGTNTTSASADVNVQIAGSTGGLPPGDYQESDGEITTTNGSNTTTILVIVGILVVLGIIIAKRK